MQLILAEDQFLLRNGLIQLLESHELTVTEAVSTGPDLVRALAGPRPDLALVDIRLPPTFTDEGLRAALDARREHPGLPVVVLSQYVEQLYAKELLADGRGAVGYLLKDRVFDGDQFVSALHAVAAGGTVMDPSVVSGLIRRNAESEPLGRLTGREREVLGLMAEGRSNASIAASLTVTQKAVAKHISSILMKLDLPQSEDDNRRVLAVLAYLSAER